MGIKERIVKLLEVKSIVTISTTAVFCVLALTDKITAEQFLTIFTMITGFYFGTRYGKTEVDK